jgi:hypothetical protein
MLAPDICVYVLLVQGCYGLCLTATWSCKSALHHRYIGNVSVEAACLLADGYAFAESMLPLLCTLQVSFDSTSLTATFQNQLGCLVVAT